MPTAFEDLDDASCRRLTTAIRRGDGAAFESFYATFFDPCLLWTRRMTKRDEAFCLDCVQDVMLCVAKELPRLGDKRSLSAWLHRCLHTKAIDRLRSEARRHAREQHAAQPEAAYACPDPLADLVASERVAWLEGRLLQLDIDDRSLLEARFVDGETLDASGARIGIGGNAAHGRIRRLLARLRSADHA